QNGVTVSLGDPKDEVAGESIVLPAHPSLLRAAEVDLDHMRRSLILHAASTIDRAPTDADVAFLAAETKTSEAFVREALN
ncbi:MAG: PLP-dependent lyase/thiolase, partial [Clostridiales bacterium]|nr:PLP-dependent lyase/thiolase [Clostridiales bacterium]